MIHNAHLHHALWTLTLLTSLFSATSCKKENRKSDPIAVKKQLTVDTRNYENWTYINLKTGAVKTLRDFSEWHIYKGKEIIQTIPAQGSLADVGMDWHIAIHRYDIRTNEGAVIETKATSLAGLTDFPTTGYTEDEEIKETLMIRFNMADMMKGIFGRAATAKVNPVFAKWIKKVGMGTYERSGLVYVVKCKNGGYAKIFFDDHTGDTGENGIVTFSYEYTEEA